MTRRLPSLNALRAFEAAARHESFTRAAAELHVTPAAISQQVATLEQYLGLRLFERFNRALRLTDAGHAALPDLRAGFDLLARGVARAGEAESSGPLVVSASPSMASKWLVPRLDDFAARLPEIDVQLSAQYELPDFRGDDTDVAIHFGIGVYPDELAVDKLFAVRIVPVCSPALLEGPEALREPADLVRFRLLHDDALSQDPDQPGWSTWLAAAGVAGIDDSRGSHFSHGIHALDAAVDGQGVLLAIDLLVESEVASGRLVRPFGLALPIRGGYYLVTPKDALERIKVRAFCDWVRETAAAERELTGSAAPAVPHRRSA